MTSEAPSCEAVLPYEATRALELIECSAAWVRPQQVSSLVRLLTEKLRQPETAHLKRVSRKPPPEGAAVHEGPAICVLLWLGGPAELCALPAGLQESLGAFELRPQSVHVPRHAPMTREQFGSWNEHWPLTYHETAVQHALSAWPPPPPAPEREAMAAHMRAAIQLAQRAQAESGRRAVAALIVRPGSRGGAEAGARVLAACADCTCGGGDGSSGGSGSGGKRDRHPLHHALMVCIEEVARQQRLAQPPLTAGSKRAAPGGGSSSSSNGGGVGDEGAGDIAMGAEAARRGGGDGPTEYLCSGCDAYVTLEPCAMCAMALAHSRIRRVIYAVPCATQGALGSRYRLHTERSINHHYQVYRGLLCDEARAALDPDESIAA